MSQDGKIPRAVAPAGPVLILIHHDIEPPVQPVFNPPMLASDVVETLCGQRRTNTTAGLYAACVVFVGANGRAGRVADVSVAMLTSAGRCAAAVTSG